MVVLDEQTLQGATGDEWTLGGKAIGSELCLAGVALSCRPRGVALGAHDDETAGEVIQLLLQK